jgi:galactose mutarotase-like enzyme
MQIKRSNQDCSISDDWALKGMKVVYLENAFLRIGILADRGSDIFEFKYKPLDLDFLLRLDKGIQNPTQVFSQMRDTHNQSEDYYYGGWQEILPNSPSFNYRGASLGLHGEVSLIPWKYAIVKDTPDEVAVKFWTRPLRMPLLIEKTLSLQKNSSQLIITEQLTNESGTELDIMWGHHIAFGLPFLKEGAKIETNAKTMEVHDDIVEPRRFKAGKTYNWPQAEDPTGKAFDASVIPNTDAPAYRDLSFLSNFETSNNKAHYNITNADQKIGFSVSWDAQIFKCLWLWQERNASQDFPWWGKCYTVALEPWTSKYTNESDKAIQKGEWLSIKAGEVISTSLSAGAIVTK